MEIPVSHLRALRHSNALRVKHHAEADFRRSRLMNLDRLDAKLLRDTGLTYREWRKELDGKGLLFR